MPDYSRCYLTNAILKPDTDHEAASNLLRTGGLQPISLQSVITSMGSVSPWNDRDHLESSDCTRSFMMRSKN